MGIRKTLPSCRKVVMKAFAQKNSIKRVEVVQTAIATSTTNFNIVASPLSFSVYIIPYSTVKKQRISGKVYVKFAAGRFINIDLT